MVRIIPIGLTVTQVAERRSTNALEDARTLTLFSDHQLEDPRLLSLEARKLYRLRRARDREMPEGLMGEPAWDMLLALFGEDPSALPISSLCFGTGVPRTSAERWISMLEQLNLITRIEHPRDRAIVQVALTLEGRRLMKQAIQSMLRATDA